MRLKEALIEVSEEAELLLKGLSVESSAAVAWKFIAVFIAVITVITAITAITIQAIVAQAPPPPCSWKCAASNVSKVFGL